jgi:DNA-3-methyladenine glycosylase
VSCKNSSFYQRPTEVVAKDLVGKKLVRTIRNNKKQFRLAGIIVETEAYGYSDDLASHACVGPTGRNKVMFGNVGRAYVYFTYGNHFCLNVSARRSDVEAGAVLIRGIEPVEGIELMRQFRPVDDIFSLTSGPGKLTQALNITSTLNGTDMTSSESEIYIEFGKRPKRIVTTPRIGITRAVDKEWRFVDPSSPFVSRKFQIKSSPPPSSLLL